MAQKEMKEFWEEKKEIAMKKLETARAKQTLKKLNREIQVCDMMLRGLNT